MGSEADPASLPAPSSVIAPLPIPPDATEEQLIGLWLHGKSANTVPLGYKIAVPSEAITPLSVAETTFAVPVVIVFVTSAMLRTFPWPFCSS
jgi:hypothetical protein